MRFKLYIDIKYKRMYNSKIVEFLNVKYAKQKLEMLQSALDKPAVIDALGEKYERVADCAGRLVIVSSLDDNLSSPMLNEPNTIPLVPIPHLGMFIYSKGAFQFSDRQRLHVEASLQSWGSPYDADHLGAAYKEVGAEVLGGVIFDFSRNHGAQNSAVAIPYSPQQVKDLLETEHLPKGRLIRVALRPAMAVSPVHTLNDDTSDMFVHELIHNIQKEDSPVTMFNSQQEVVEESIRSELEAYHYGAQVRVALDGLSSIEDYSEAQLRSSPSLGIEAARRLFQQSSDPFDPSVALARRISKKVECGEFYAVDVDIEALVPKKDEERVKSEPKKLPPKAKKSRGRTTKPR